MEYFRRVLVYVGRQYKAVLLSILCALLVAMLFTLSIGAMLPLMKIMIGEEGLHGWVERAVIKHRSGISFAAKESRETLSDDNEQTPRPDVPFAIVSIKKDSPATDSGLKELDVILLVNPLDSPAPEKLTSEQHLECLAWADSDHPIRPFTHPWLNGCSTLSPATRAPISNVTASSSSSLSY
jgi:hypothetical protein